MREILLVVLSALVGYIVFSAFSTSDTPSEAFKKIIEQPQNRIEIDKTLAANKINNQHEEKLISLENARDIEQLKVYSKIKIYDKESETRIALKRLDNSYNQQLAMLQLQAQNKDKNKDNLTIIVLALLLFLLLFIYLKHKKHLTEIELRRQAKYDEMMAKKAYAEKILAYISQGDLSFETERKLLRLLDELNGKTVKPVENNQIFHPNPDIIQLSNRRP
jgi:hypothetical protein